MIFGLFLATAAASAQTTPSTEVGTLVHFPTKLHNDWAPAEAAVADAARALGPGAWLRFDALWHEIYWSPNYSNGYNRMDKIISIIRKNNLRPLMDVIPHPWPSSWWYTGGSNFAWGGPPSSIFPKIAERYAETVEAYKSAVKRNGYDESQVCIQFGNEPAAGHPGGNDRLPIGTWSGAPLWTQCQRVAKYGRLQVLSPALSMQDHNATTALRERTTAVAGAATWTAPVTTHSLHNRLYARHLSGDAYGAEYARVLTQRANMTLNLNWGRGTGDKKSTRLKGVAVTEGYVAVGDAGGNRSDAVAAVARRVKAGIPGVSIFIFYRWHPEPRGGETAWTFSASDRAAIKNVFNPGTGIVP